MEEEEKERRGSSVSLWGGGKNLAWKVEGGRAERAERREEVAAAAVAVAGAGAGIGIGGWGW